MVTKFGQFPVIRIDCKMLLNNFLFLSSRRVFIYLSLFIIFIFFSLLCFSCSGPLYVIVEYAANGNLKDFLRQHRTHYYENSVAMVKSNSPTKKDLLSAALQVSYTPLFKKPIILSSFSCYFFLLFFFSLSLYLTFC